MRATPERRLPQHDGVFPRRRSRSANSMLDEARSSRAGRALAGVPVASPGPPPPPVLRASSGSSAPNLHLSWRGVEFDFARAEDKECRLRGQDPNSSPRSTWAKAVRLGANETSILGAIDDYFRNISDKDPPGRAGQDRVANQTSHVRGPARPSPSGPIAGRSRVGERDGVAAFYRELARERRAGPRGRRPRLDRRHPHVPPLLLPGGPARSAGTGIRPLSGHGLASRLSYFLWSSMPDDGADGPKAVLGRPENGPRSLVAIRPAGCSGTTGASGPGHGIRRQLARLPPVRGTQQRRPQARFPQTFDDELRRSMFEEPVRFLLDVIREQPIGASPSSTPDPYVRQPEPRPPLRDGRATGRQAPTDWVRVDDATPQVRRGAACLTMAVFLTKNSPGTEDQPGQARLLGSPDDSSARTSPAPPAKRPRSAGRRGQGSERSPSASRSRSPPGG